jgi:hypothetical protein
VLGRLYGLEAFGIKLGLENIERLTEALGHPERTFRSLHVAGTNGKGSVTAMAHAALRQAGLQAARTWRRSPNGSSSATCLSRRVTSKRSRATCSIPPTVCSPPA